MVHSHHQAELDALLQHPALWRGRGAALPAGFSSGFAELDAVLPGGGWPQHGLIEVLTPGGCGELALWAPLVQRLTHAINARWCAFVAPPFEPFAPAWSAQGARSDRLLVVRAPGSSSEPLWALEQCLLSGACFMAFGWVQRASMTALRRLALAAERGAALGVLIRPLRVASEHTAAALRIAITRNAAHLTLQLLKGRGVSPCTIELALP
jgi:hypothetical protein